MTINARTPIVHADGRPTREFLAAYNDLNGGTTGSLGVRVTNLEVLTALHTSQITVLQGQVSTQAVDIAALQAADAVIQARLDELEVLSMRAPVWL